MCVARRALRVGAHLMLVLMVWEVCARIDDASSDRAPLLGAHDYTVMLKHDALGVTGVPFAHYQKWQLNSLGFRGPELQAQRARIICIGSSETFGLYEAPGMEYPRQLERELSSRSSANQYEVANVAYAGQTLGSFLRRSGQVISRLQPEIAVIYPGLTSYIEPSSADTDAWVPEKQHFQLRIKAKLFNLLDRVLPGPLQTARYRFKIWRNTRGRPVMERIPESDVGRFRQDLSQLLDTLKQHNVKAVLVTHATRFGTEVLREDLPLLTQWRSAYPNLKEDGFLDMEVRLNAVMREQAAARDLPLVDAAKMLSGQSYFADWAHFTDRGAHAMASAIAEVILARWPAERHDASTSIVMLRSNYGCDGRTPGLTKPSNSGVGICQ